MARRLFFAVLIAVWLLANLLTAAELSFLEIGNLGGKGDFGRSSRAFGISGNGRAVVGDSLASVGLGIAGDNEAFLWVKPGPMRGLGVLSPNALFSSARDVSTRGDVVVGESQTDAGKRAFRWSSVDGLVNLGTLPRHDRSIACGVSGDGKVIVGTSSGNDTMAFRWTAPEKMVALGHLPRGGTKSAALAISEDGQVIVGRGNSDRGVEAFRWTAATGMQALGDLSGGRFASAAFAVSSDGSVVVGQSHSERGAEAFRWATAKGMVGIGDLPGGRFASTAFGVSANGAVVVGQADAANGAEAFVWDARAGMRSIGQLLQQRKLAPGWQLREARGVSSDGSTIVGVGRNPNGETAAWLVHIAR